MTVHRWLAVLLAGLVGACSAPADEAAPEVEADAASTFLGTWTLVNWEARVGEAEAVYPFGEDAIGRIMYDAAGHMSVQLLVPDRPRFASPDFTAGTSTEIEAAFEGFFAYFGSYSVDEVAGTVTHELEAALFPNWTGTEQVRSYVFEGDTLVLRTPPTIGQGVEAIHTLKWVRAH